MWLAVLRTLDLQGSRRSRLSAPARRRPRFIWFEQAFAQVADLAAFSLSKRRASKRKPRQWRRDSDIIATLARELE